MRLSSPSRQRAFTLVELAVVMAIVGLLLASLMYTLSAQTEQRAREQTQRTLEQARDALLGYAVANGRLPCPAPGTASSAIESPAGGGTCTNPYDGFLPAVTLGFQPVDAQGFALDAWNNRIRYAVARSAVSCVSGSANGEHFTNKTVLRQQGMTCRPNSTDLLICKSATTGPVPGDCQTQTDNAVTNLATVAAIVFSTGRNYALAPTAAAATSAGKTDEAANLDGNSVFISHVLAPTGAAGGEFDDQMIWISVGQFYGRLSTAGVLP